MQKEVRYYEKQVKERDDKIWRLEEELAGLKNVDLEEQLRAERQKNTDLEAQLGYSKTKIGELESETHQLQSYKNEAQVIEKK
jgi:DNA repair exonuclease SbcCD ATPase subunit